MRLYGDGFFMFQRRFKLSFQRLPYTGDGWHRYIANVGPLLLSWSWSCDDEA